MDVGNTSAPEMHSLCASRNSCGTPCKDFQPSELLWDLGIAHRKQNRQRSHQTSCCGMASSGILGCIFTATLHIVPVKDCAFSWCANKSCNSRVVACSGTGHPAAFWFNLLLIAHGVSMAQALLRSRAMLQVLWQTPLVPSPGGDRPVFNIKRVEVFADTRVLCPGAW
jgi:hypothetical protein